MTEKPDLSSTAGVQNVVVYVSNDNFAQTYAIEQQNVPQQSNVRQSGYPNSSHQMAPVGQTKNFSEKQIFTSSEQLVNSCAQGGYLNNVISSNGFPLNNISYQNAAIVKNFLDSEVISCERQQTGPGRPETVIRDDCDNRDRYSEPFVTILGSEVSAQSVRCDSVRSETAESSCSSSNSSADESIVLVQNRSPDMVVYDPSVSVRPGGVVLVGPSPLPQNAHSSPMVGASQAQFVTVPYGWKRLLNNGSVVYISPSNTALNSLELVKEYLLTTGTCKCGLECHFKYETVFNFDPKVIGKPWTLSPDTNTGDLTKLCNHKRKIMAMASLHCKPPDPGARMGKDYGFKRKKGRIGVPYAGGVSISQILAQRDKFALGQQVFNKDVGSRQQVWSAANNPNNVAVQGRLQGFPEGPNNQMLRCREQPGNSIIPNSQVVLGENTNINPQSNMSSTITNQSMQINPQVPHNSGPNVHLNSHQIIGPNGQIINLQGIPQDHGSAMHQNRNQIIQGHNQHTNTLQSEHQQHSQNRLFNNGQPNEHSGPGRPNMQVMSSNMPAQPGKVADMQRKIQQQIYNHQQIQYQQIDPCKNTRQFDPTSNSIRPQCIPNQNQLIHSNIMQMQQQQKMQWQNRIPQNINNQPNLNQINQLSVQQQNMQNMQNPNVYERVPPLHQHTPSAMWQEEIRPKKVKPGKAVKSRQYHVGDNCQSNHGICPNIDVRRIPIENQRSVVVNQIQNYNSSSPSFMEDPSGYLAQQTALLNNTINSQTGANSSLVCSSSSPSIHTADHNVISISNTQPTEVPFPNNMNMHLKHQQMQQMNPNVNLLKQVQQSATTSHQHFSQINEVQTQQQNVADSSAFHDQTMHQYVQQCQGCLSDASKFINNQKGKNICHSESQPSTPSSYGTSEDPVTSSMYPEKLISQPSPDTRPIQGGTISTSNVSPIDNTLSDPPTPNSHIHTPTPTSPKRILVPAQSSSSNNFSIQQHQTHNVQVIPQSKDSFIQKQNQHKAKQEPINSQALLRMPEFITSIVTTMASGRTSGCNTITSVLAGRTNTSTVSINSPANSHSGSNTPTSTSSPTTHLQPVNVNVSKSPLEMVQSVVSSIQVPQSQQSVSLSVTHASSQVSPQIIKHSPTGLPPGNFLVSSNGQLIMASTGNGQQNVMAPPPPKVIGNQNAMPPISVSPIVTNVTAAVTQVIPAVAQQVLGQQTVLVNALPAPFVIQPGVTMTMDGMTVGQNMQLPQIVTGNVIQQQIQLDNCDARRAPALLSPEPKKKAKKRKLQSSQTVAGMLHIAAHQNSGMVMSQQGFPQQIQMTHSPQGINPPVMQALTIVPNKTGGPPQIVMNGQAVANTSLGTQQIITNSQPAQQINLLQPVNLINGTTGVVQNFPTIQQFIVPNIGGSMVVNPDGTATILQDTSNLGMQLQIQNVNGQNVLTPIQNSNMFNAGQSILAAGPAGMVIRAPTSQGKIIQQQHSPGAQFLSPNGGPFVVNGTQFSGQLSPLIASVSPSQQVTFSTSPQQIRPNNQIQPAQQDFIQMNGQMGATLMVPCSPQATNISSSSANQQNTTFVQQNTTIVQQQTTMVANNQQLQNIPQNSQQGSQNVAARSAQVNVDQQNFIISSNDNKPMQAVLVQQRSSPHENLNYRQSVSTQTAVNQNSQAVTTNTFCLTSTLSAGSPPDTTTLSPMASGGQSPPTVDTTTHTGSTDDGLSPAPSSCSASFSDINVPGRPGSCTMAMVHCVSSSEPDLTDSNTQNLDQEWRRLSQTSSTKQEFNSAKQEFADVISGHMHFGKKQNAAHVAFAESSNMISEMQFLEHQMKQEVVSSRQYEKTIHQKKSTNMVVVVDAGHMSILNDDDEVEN